MKIPMSFTPKASIAPWNRTASDWRTQGLASFELGVAGLDGAYWAFIFQSVNAQVTCVYTFVGGGVEVGNSLLPINLAKLRSGSPIRGFRGFCAADLNGAGGMVISAGWNLPWISIGTLRITAFDRGFIPYFSYQPVTGPTSTPSLGASWVDGRWMLHSLFDTQARKTWNSISLNTALRKS